MREREFVVLGTGKTESVKALGHALGRFVLVFNCDESFDFQVNEKKKLLIIIIFSLFRLWVVFLLVSVKSVSNLMD
jgi:hypothetical protein